MNFQKKTMHTSIVWSLLIGVHRLLDPSSPVNLDIPRFWALAAGLCKVTVVLESYLLWQGWLTQNLRRTIVVEPPKRSGNP